MCLSECGSVQVWRRVCRGVQSHSLLPLADKSGCGLEASLISNVDHFKELSVAEGEPEGGERTCYEEEEEEVEEERMLK